MLHCKCLKSNKSFLHSANNTASNALDWETVHLHTSLPYSNDGQKMDEITCLLTYKLKLGLSKILKILHTCIPYAYLPLG